MDEDLARQEAVRLQRSGVHCRLPTESLLTVPTDSYKNPFETSQTYAKAD